MTGAGRVGLALLTTLAALAAFAAGGASRAWAAAAPARVTVVLPADADEEMREVATRTHAELVTGGIAATIVAEAPAGGAGITVAIRREGDETITEVTPPARAPGAAAATGSTVVRVRESATDPRVLAIRAVELVRAMLLESAGPPAAPPPAVVVAPAPPPPPRAPALPPPASEPPEPVRWSLGVGGAWLQSTAGIGAAFGAVAFAEVLLRRGLGVSLLAAVAERGGNVRTPVGAVATDQELVALELTYRLRHDRAVQPRLMLGLGGYHLGARGTPDPDSHVMGGSAHAWAALATGGAGLALRLTRVMRAYGDVRALFTNPYPAIAKGNEVARAGNPSLLVSVGLERAF